MSVCIGVTGLEACTQGQPAAPEREDSSAEDAGANTPYSCPDANAPTCPDGGPAPSWKTQVKAIADRWCATCHFAGDLSGLDFSTPAGFLHDKTTAESDILTCNMPPPGNGELSPADWETLLEWLSCGAPDN
jgi:hypothetical protein